MIRIRNIVVACVIPLMLAACGGSQKPATEAAASESITEPAEPVEGTETAAAAAEAEPAEPPAPEPAELGKPAPDFSLMDLQGTQVSLADYRGKTVVLEWFNPGCPFIKYAHGKGPLKSALPGGQSENIAWLAINSSAPGNEGHGQELNAKHHAEWKMSYPVLIDEDGKIGRLYDAKTTPHMFVIDPQGVLVYRGALDNAPLGKAKDKKVNYVEMALADLAAGRPVATPETQAYGCSVKYAE